MWWWLWACSGADKGPGPSDTAHTGLEDADEDGFAAGQDCDDGDRFTYPGAPDEAYDGVDSDCANDDDFDADGDGHRPPEHEGADCNDFDESVSPDADEAPYDGSDNDCDPATPDDDVDGDGFRVFEECDDTDASAFPGAFEVAFDGVDQDCDGAVDATPFGEVPWDFVVPEPPRAVDTPHGVAVLVRARSVTRPGLDPEDDPVVVVPLPHTLQGAGPLEEPATVVWGLADADPVADAAVAVVGDGLSAGFAWLAGNGYGYLATLALEFVPGVGWFPGQLSYTEDVFQEHTAVDVWEVGGDVYAAGGGAQGVGYARAGGLFADGGLDPGAAGGVATFRDPGAPDTFVTCDAADCTSWTYDPDLADPRPRRATAQPWAGSGVATARVRGGQLTWTDGGPGLSWTDGTASVVVLGTESVTAGELVVVDDVLYGVAVVNGALHLLRGPLAGPFDDVVLPVVTAGGRTLSPTGASLVVRPGSMFLAVSALDTTGGADAVLYATLQR